MPCTPDSRHRQASAELECLCRLRAVRDIIDAFLLGHWPLDVELLLLTAEILDSAGAWALTAEQAARPEATAA